MKKLWKNRPILIALLASALFLVLAALTVGRRTASRAEDMFSSAVLPVQEAVSNVTDRVTDFFTRVFYPSRIQEENERLNQLVAAYERRLILYEAMEQENARLAELLVSGGDLRADERTEKHADWAETLKAKYAFTPENVEGILRDEVGVVFSRVLAHAGVYKRSPAGKEAFLRFAAAVGTAEN